MCQSLTHTAALQAATSARKLEEQDSFHAATVDSVREDALSETVPLEEYRAAQEEIELLEESLGDLAAQNEALADELVKCQCEAAELNAARDVHEDAIGGLERTLTNIERQV